MLDFTQHSEVTMWIPRVLVSAFFVLGGINLCTTANVASAAEQDLAALKGAWTTLDRKTQSWSSSLSGLEATMSRLEIEAGISALANARSHIETMRGVLEAGIGEDDAYDLVFFKYSKARLYLTLARSAMSRAHTATVTAPAAPETFMEQITSFIASMDALLQADPTVDHVAP
jgi:hypothetical protein